MFCDIKLQLVLNVQPFISRVQESLDSLKEKISPNSVGQGNLSPHLTFQQAVEGDFFKLFF